ncbi:hypothetical protein D3C80_1821260 [compost metagenome]
MRPTRNCPDTTKVECAQSLRVNVRKVIVLDVVLYQDLPVHILVKRKTSDLSHLLVRKFIAI